MECIFKILQLLFFSCMPKNKYNGHILSLSNYKRLVILARCPKLKNIRNKKKLKKYCYLQIVRTQEDVNTRSRCIMTRIV